MELWEYYRPPGDTGVGFHYTAAATQGNDPDRFEPWGREMVRMGASWVKILSPSVATAQRARSLGLEPIDREYIKEPGACPIEGEPLHRQQLLIQNGFRWIQDPHNEVNNSGENPGGVIASPEDLAKVWVPWAKQIIVWGGYPSTPALAPGGNADDLTYLRRFLDEVNRIEPRREGEPHPIWDRGAWCAVHNYTLNRPLDWYSTVGYDEGRLPSPDWRCSWQGYKLVAAAVHLAAGHPIPVLSCEGGPAVGADDGKDMPPVSMEMHRDWSEQIVWTMRTTAEPWYFTCMFWLIANKAAEHFDMAWETQAWFSDLWPDGQLPAVDRLRAIPRVARTNVALPPGPVDPEEPIEEEPKPMPRLTEQFPEIYKLWVEDGGVEDAFRKHLLGIGSLPASAEDLTFLAGQVQASVDQLKGALDRYPFPDLPAQ